ANIGPALIQYAQGNTFLVRDGKSGDWKYVAGLLKSALQPYGWNEDTFKDPLGGKLDLERLSQILPEVTPANLGRVVTQARLWQIHGMVAQRIAAHKDWLKDSKLTVAEAVIFDETMRTLGWPAQWFKDAWGQPLRLVVRGDKPTHPVAGKYELVS